MYRTARVAITSLDDTARVHLGGTNHTIPLITFGSDAEGFEISLNSKLLTPAEQAEWLRRFAHQVTSLAEIIDAANVNSGSNVDEYRCAHCGAQFGIAGESTGSPEDLAADEFYRAEVEHHATGLCKQAVAS